MERFITRLFAANPDIRYVALYRSEQLVSASRPGLKQASSAESDTWEELIVNPTLLTLTRQRGNIDCGGCRYLLVRYGNFFQLVMPLSDGHLSVCIEPHADVAAVVRLVEEAAAGL